MYCHSLFFMEGRVSPALIYFPSLSAFFCCLFSFVPIASLSLLSYQLNFLASYLHTFYPMTVPSAPPSPLCILWWHLFATQAAGSLRFCSVIWLLPFPEWGHSLGQRRRDRTLTNTHMHKHTLNHFTLSSFSWIKQRANHILFWRRVFISVHFWVFMQVYPEHTFVCVLVIGV